MSDWPGSGSKSTAAGYPSNTVKPVSSRQLSFADDIAVRLATSEKGLLWLKAPAGSGKTTFLEHSIPAWPFPSLRLDLRREREVMTDTSRVPEDSDIGKSVVLVLDDMSPRDLVTLMADPLHPASQIVPNHAGSILLVSDETNDDAAIELSALLGRQLQAVSMPPTSYEQRLSILRARQSRIERQLRVCILPHALARAARGRAPKFSETPGMSIHWLEAAATRVCLRAMHGDPQLRALEAQIEDLNRALLVALARDEGAESLQKRLEHVEIEHAAYTVDWHERERAGELHQVTAFDVEYEIEAEKAMSTRKLGSDVVCEDVDPKTEDVGSRTERVHLGFG